MICGIKSGQISFLLTCFLLVLLSACGKSEPPVGVVYVQYEAELDERRPTFTRPDPSNTLSEAERTNPYHRRSFKVEASGWYALESSQNFDGYLLLYKGQINTSDSEALRDPIGVNDDHKGRFNPAAIPPGTSRIRAELKAGETYTLITTFYCNGDEETCGPREGSFLNTVTSIETPPPPFKLPEPDPERFNITVRFLNDDLTDEQKSAFTEAAERWSEVITGDLNDFVLDQPQEFASGAPEVVGTIDDILIDTRFIVEDGPNGVLGRAGPKFIRAEGEADAKLTIYGTMELDIAEFEPGGFFTDPQAYRDVILHEMGHVIGIGTLWEVKELTESVLPNPPSVTPSVPNPAYDPRFTGEGTVAVYQSLLQAAGKPAEETVPIANTGGPGNYNGHWRELVFDNELMTPYAGGLERLSSLTAASLADLGYEVDVNSAEIDRTYALPLAAELEQLAPTPVEYAEFFEFLKFSGSQGSAAASVQTVDLYTQVDADPSNPNSLHPVNSTSGCETADFVDFSAGNIVLIQRGGCLFNEKIQNAVAAGASGIIMFNQGDDPSLARQDLFRPGAASPIPAVAISFDLGVDLADIARSADLRMRIDTPTPANMGASLKAGPTRVTPLNEHLLRPTHAVTASGKFIPLKSNPEVVQEPSDTEGQNKD